MKNNHFDDLFKLKHSGYLCSDKLAASLACSSARTPVFGAIWQPLEYLNALMNT